MRLKPGLTYACLIALAVLDQVVSYTAGTPPRFAAPFLAAAAIIGVMQWYHRSR